MKAKKLGKFLVSLLFLLVLLLLLYQYTSAPHINEDVPLPDQLHPKVAENRDILIQEGAEKGIQIIITDGFRSKADQDRLYEQGRSEDGNIVTYAKGGESYHNFGLAIDFALLSKEGKAIWDMNYDGNGNGESDWMEVVAIAKDLGFEWGGDWKRFKDYPHLEMPFGLSIHELQRGKRPPGSDVLK
ncbi:M15 family metallopeptidase [Mesobacillus harenae]|uniref:M15 family metallopeptidase n=1 Tax=Mesobacillus harenae TaxID=2213203 RepID=UPI00157FFA69